MMHASLRVVRLRENMMTNFLRFISTEIGTDYTCLVAVWNCQY